MQTKVRRRRRRVHHGAGIKDVLKKVHDFIKDRKIISRGAAALAPLAGPYSGHVSTFGKAAGALGYGRRKVRRVRRKRY